jgi:hypothetical protein
VVLEVMRISLTVMSCGRCLPLRRDMASNFYGRWP